eukprot:TRINITY_DN19920_c0_g1::TRINITY_DN19920_c0_g1_i1::g.28934::m.28934 TRINITY_DN19920_c0_g1::TRINITY_DN19920_c0_g1_i1::g.28934  ORF type:complete len:200 (+),score=46.80,SUR7/PF06687.7/0.019,Claudin_2/PF13903.1/0.066,DUF2207/PF09972.4/1,MARVEL/PF01284.18/7.7,Hum_adeno_E3A/PF05393.6/7.8,Hum_adeno_E3A/PF05393.6/37 TRINITY_DN19920_c0_g1_i1:85-684(+)
MRTFIGPFLIFLNLGICVLLLGIDSWTYVEFNDGQDSEEYGLITYQPGPAGVTLLTGLSYENADDSTDREEYDCTKAVGNSCDTVKSTGAGVLAVTMIGGLFSLIGVILGFLFAFNRLNSHWPSTAFYFIASIIYLISVAAWAGRAHDEIVDLYEDVVSCDIYYGASWRILCAVMSVSFLIGIINIIILRKRAVAPIEP